ncbi:MAG: hypothetical protein AAB224_04415 [Gemmatimonadota bacterium]
MTRWHFTLAVAIWAAAWAAACGTSSSDRSPTPEAGTPDPGTPAAGTHDVAPGGTGLMSWPDAVGGLLAIADAATDEALVFRRDTTAIPGQVGVVGYDSAATVATVRTLRAAPCASRAILQLAGAPGRWNLALDLSHAHPLLVDALADLSPADSQRVVVRIQRALNTLPDTGAAMEFRGLPVVVRDAWVVGLSPGPVVVARAARLRNLEATAHEELRFVVLEGDQLRYVARVAGDEEVVESWDLLAVLTVEGHPWLAVAREGAGSLQLELVARDRTAWRSVWRSDGLVCGASR